MSKLTPPVAAIRFTKQPDRVEDGEQVQFRMWLGVVPVEWTAQFSDVNETGFVDSQVEGPFAFWQHTHSFEAVEGGTEIHDRIEYETSGWVSRTMALTLPTLFAFRKIQSRRLIP